MSAPSDLNWDRLPDDPIGFFGLADGFDRKDLKRAYTRLIKHFKPERAPDEFKKIRSAYEELEDRLRFGQSMSGVSVTPRASTDAPGPSSAAHSGFPTDADDTIPRLDPRALVREHGPGKARELIRQAAGTAPAPWVALALIDDALASTDAAPFDTLMEAAEVTREHETVLALLGQLLRAEMPMPKAVKVMQLVARAAQASRRAHPGASALAQNYWFLTGPQWLTLARKLPFESFEKLMGAVEPLVGEEGFLGRLMLGLRLRRILAFKASDTWLKELDEDLEEAYQMLPEWADEELEFNRRLHTYREQRPMLLDGSEVRTLIDEAIHDLVELEPGEADRAFVAFNLELTDRRDEVLTNFDHPEESAYVIGHVLYSYGLEWRERRGIEVEDVGGVGQKRIEEFVRRVDKRGDRTLVARVWNYLGLLLCLLAISVPVAVGSYLSSIYGPQAWAIPVVIGGVVFLGIKQGWAYYPMTKLSAYFAPKVHRRVWRPEAAAFMAETRCPHESLVGGLDEITSGDAVFIAEAIREDLGLHLYGQAMLAIDD